MRTAQFLIFLLLSSLCAAQTSDTRKNESRTVIGPSNIDLADGAAALRIGDVEEGVMLTQRGLRSAASERDRVAGYSNLCAGLIMLSRYEEAVEACDSAIMLNDRHWRAFSNRALAYIKLQRYPEAERDIRRGEELNPTARNLKVVKSMYLDATDPVTPSIIIDDRRQGPGDDG